MLLQLMKTCVFAVFYATAPVQLTFEQFSHAEIIDAEALREYDGQTVQIKGFLFKSPENQWILTSEPNLPSCCVGSSKKVQSQVVINKQFNTKLINHVVSITGVFSIDVQRGNDGIVKQMYVLNKVDEVEVPRGSMRASHILLGLVALGVLSAVWFLRQRRRIED